MSLAAKFHAVSSCVIYCRHCTCPFASQLAELTKDTYVFGRDPLCDYSFSNSALETNPHMQAFSKYHFRVYKVCVFACMCVFAYAGICVCVPM